MKYLLSEFLLEEDAEKFMREHEGCEFVNEYLLGGFLHAAVMQEVWKKIKTGELKVDAKAMLDGTAQGIIAYIDAIVCYPENAEGYAVWDKKIITVEHPEA